LPLPNKEPTPTGDATLIKGKEQNVDLSPSSRKTLGLLKRRGQKSVYHDNILECGKKQNN